MLLKVILFACRRGIVSSRNIERACREQVTFMALPRDSQPHFTTLAGFVSSLSPMMPKPAPASAQPANSFTGMDQTASTTAIPASNSPVRKEIACPVPSASNACALPGRPLQKGRKSPILDTRSSPGISNF
ncbi:MAG: hypothetical protein C3F18_00195 [Nitrosomonadales bacterium]|nr:MAG: hypothetical protein C3F18_00195 [Nitrosomonadales bacterium]